MKQKGENMRLIDADKFKENFIKRFHCDPLVTGWKDSENLSFVLNEEPTVSIKELENLRETTTFFFVEYGKDSSWVCDRCGGNVKGFESPKYNGYNFCPYCGAKIE
jgi:DNA-directed RNA polymerase subunit RPC12/RpoP